MTMKIYGIMILKTFGSNIAAIQAHFNKYSARIMLIVKMYLTFFLAAKLVEILLETLRM